MINQSTVGDTDENNSDLIIDYSGINIDLDLDKKCDDDSKDKQPDTKKQKNTYGFEDILNTKIMIPLKRIKKQI